MFTANPQRRRRKSSFQAESELLPSCCTMPLLRGLAGAALLLSFIAFSAAPAFSQSRVAARHGMVVSSEPLAADAGLEILRAGGNAVDAAVAVGFAMAVTYPVAGNIGGGGFMLIRRPSGESIAVDYREAAPAAATRNMYLDARGTRLRNRVR